MQAQQKKLKDETDLRDQVWTFVKEMHVCMLTSWDGQKQHSRPMTPHLLADDPTIYFLDRYDSQKEREIAKYPAVSLTFMAPNRNTYLNIRGEASISNDRARIESLWSSLDKNWWSSANDPSIRVIAFVPDEAELWDGPNSLVAAGIMLLAAATGSQMAMGTNSKIKL